MKKLLVILIIILGSCGPREYPKMEKPFVIIDKFAHSQACNKGDCRYTYQDVNGEIQDFCDEGQKYDIGDTIK